MEVGRTETRQQIRSAALWLFAMKNRDGTPMQKISGFPGLASSLTTCGSASNT